MENLPLHPSGNQLVLGNYFKFQNTKPINRYIVTINPPPQAQTPPQRICSQLVPKMKDYFQQVFMNTGSVIYSTTKATDEFNEEVQYEGIVYAVNIKMMNALENESSKEKMNFYGRFFKGLQKQLRYTMIGRKYFNSSKAKEYNNLKLTVWPGFMTSVISNGQDAFLNVDVNYKIIRLDTVLDFMNQNRSDFNKLQEFLENQTVMTSYNKRMYRVSKILFDKTPQNTSFIDKKSNKEINLLQYYQERYKRTISQPDQPLLLNVDRKTGQEILLVPELCHMTGLSDEQRNNFNLMKELSQTTKKNASDRLFETRSLIEDLGINQRTKETLTKWQISVNSIPQGYVQRRYKAGNLVFAKQKNGNQRNQLDIENDQQAERNSQQPMYYTVGLQKWAIIYGENDTQIFDSFQQTIQQCIGTYDYPVNAPHIIPVRGYRIDNWKDAIANSGLDSSCQMAVLLLQGPKKKAPLYDELKRYLLLDKGVPSQAVCIKTLQGKGIRSICNKILTQIGSKVGSTPWAIDLLPFTQVPTMVCGVDVYHNTGRSKKSIYAFCASIDNQFSKYFSDIRFQSVGQEIGLEAQTCTENAVNAFKKATTVFPQQIIVYRDGVSDSQRVAVESIEIQAMRQAFQKLQINPKLVFICTNKKTNSKFFSCSATNQDNIKNVLSNLKNPEPGTVVSDELCSENDFFLISQKTNQGIPAPTHYYILANDFVEPNFTSEQKKAVAQKLQFLSYKLCYLYYNWLGSVKVPAPIQYAHKLSNFVGDRWQEFVPREELIQKNSLYFI